MSPQSRGEAECIRALNHWEVIYFMEAVSCCHDRHRLRICTLNVDQIRKNDPFLFKQDTKDTI